MNKGGLIQVVQFSRFANEDKYLRDKLCIEPNKSNYIVFVNTDECTHAHNSKRLVIN